METKKILLVDDSRGVLMMEQMILKAGPYELVTASDGVEAVDKSLSEKPDLILMDVVMPNMDGFEACRKIKDCEETAEIPIIMVTTRGEKVNIDKGYASGCDDYLTKPIDAVQVKDKIKKHLG